MKNVYLGLGSNLGDRLEFIRKACLEIQALPDTEIVQVSSVYETSPVGGPEQNNFYNIVVSIKSDLSAHLLLEKVQEIEISLGRVRSERFGPRTIDIDILFYGSESIYNNKLIVPHPRFADRLFVLEPLAEINPDFICNYDTSIQVIMRKAKRRFTEQSVKKIFNAEEVCKFESNCA